MAKMKPKRNTSISLNIEQLKTEHEKIINESSEIYLIDIDKIEELKLSNNLLMHNRISYSKAKLLELAENISKLAKENTGIMGTGLLNPVMIRKMGSRYERIHGENRIKAMLLNGSTKVPAVVLENVSDELARFMRTSENLNREDLNAYDSTLSILEHIQLACNFDTIDDVKKFIIKVKNFQAGKSSLNDEEKELHKIVSEVFDRIGQFDIITFVDRLSVLNLNSLVKQALVDEIINYSQAKIINSKLKSQKDIKKIIDVLTNKKLSINELKKYIADFKSSNNSNIETKYSEKDIVKNINILSKNLNKIKYLSVPEEKKQIIDSKLKSIEILFNEILNEVK